GETQIGAGTVINPGAVITDSRIGERVEIRPYCVITDSSIADDAAVGPFAHLRPGADIRNSARIGNYVEIKKAVIGEGSKVSHLTYVGDAQLGQNVNIGAGCVTCNYDGFGKHRTVIEDGVFVGSGSMLVAPVTLGKGSLVAAGSTLTRDVPPDALAIARSPQTEKEGWAARRRRKLASTDEENR
ncbi:MAG: DapH/DapD/GlmU-related protein, partial [Pseudomonadota bacterium]